MVLVQHLTRSLPTGYSASPQIHIGGVEVDVAALESESGDVSRSGGSGGTATLPQLAPAPSLTLDTDPPDVDEYALRVYETTDGERLVASVEFVSPRNKDRPESRRMFVAKCAGLLQQGVCVSLVDCVTNAHFNLYADLLDFFGHADPHMAVPPVPHIYAVTLRKREASPRWRLEMWAHPLTVGGPLPSIPLWLTDTLNLPLDLEATYEETCRTVRLPE